MRILMIVNWKIKYCNDVPTDKQPPDYYVFSEDYWFYRYFEEKPEVDVIDVSSFSWLENFEKEKIRFYIWQALKAIPKLNDYDLVVSHGMQSGVVVSLWRRLFKTKARHIVFDIGSFASASESGFALKLMQFASKSIDGLIYHTSSQIEYYKKFFPWIVKKSQFIRFGADFDFFGQKEATTLNTKDKYMICVGYNKRDWKTLIAAYKLLNTKTKLKLVGKVMQEYAGIEGVEQIPFVPVNELIDLIQNAEYSVLPLENMNYSFGQMTLLQQMALGKCVIAANVFSLKDYFEDRKTAVAYSPGDVKDLVQKIQLVDTNHQLREEIGKRASARIRTQNNEMIMAREIDLFFKKVVGENY